MPRPTSTSSWTWSTRTTPPGTGFGYALSMTRKNEKLNERPFFETDRDAPGQADHRAGRDARGRARGGGAWCWRTRAPTRPGASSSTAPSPRAKTDAQGRFRLPITTPGQGGVLGPAQGLRPRAVRGPRREARRHRDDHPEEGRLRGRPGPGCPGQADQGRVRRDRAEARDRAGSGGARPELSSPTSIRRTAETDADGRFTFDSVAPGGIHASCPASPTTMATGRSSWTRRPLPEVFAPTKLTIKEGETPAPLEIRALPSVVIEGHWVDSKGQPKGGWSSFVFGKMDGSSWNAQAHPDPQGRFSVKVPHGLEDVQLDIIDQRARLGATPDRQGRAAGRGPHGSSSARSTTTSRRSRSSGTSRRSSSSTPPRRTVSRSRISRRPSSTPSPARITRQERPRRGRREEEGRHPGRAVRRPLPDIPACCPTRR